MPNAGHGSLRPVGPEDPGSGSTADRPCGGVIPGRGGSRQTYAGPHARQRIVATHRTRKARRLSPTGRWQGPRFRVRGCCPAFVARRSGPWGRAPKTLPETSIPVGGRSADRPGHRHRCRRNGRGSGLHAWQTSSSSRSGAGASGEEAASPYGEARPARGRLARAFFGFFSRLTAARIRAGPGFARRPIPGSRRPPAPRARSRRAPRASPPSRGRHRRRRARR